MSGVHHKPRAGSTALVAGVTLFEDASMVDGYPRWRVRAVAQEGDKQRVKSWSPLRHGLANAIRQACQWRASRVEGADADVLERACWDALDRAVIERLQEAGVDVRRSGGA